MDVVLNFYYAHLACARIASEIFPGRCPARRGVGAVVIGWAGSAGPGGVGDVGCYRGAQGA